mgnify:FL=1
MKREFLMHMLPLEVWMMIYQAAHAMQYQRVIQDLRERVIHIEVNDRTQTFVVCNEINRYSVLAVF